jgi:hypothetical protein
MEENNAEMSAVYCRNCHSFKHELEDLALMFTHSYLKPLNLTVI